MDKGFIKLSRSFFDNRIWQAARAFSECEAWLDLIQSARFEATPTTSRIGCYEVTWGRGQYPASIRFLAKKWGRPEKWVREFLGRLKKENMITMENTQGVSVITLTNFEKYNGDTPNGTSNGTPNTLNDMDLQTLTAQLTAQVTAQVVENLQKEGHTYGTNNKKEEEYINNNIQEISANADTKKAAAAKGWRDDFEVYKSELKEAFDIILSDKDFIENRQKYHPNLDIRLSLQKAYEDYWCTEAGWKKKKSSRTKEIDWPATFRKALDQPQNRVYKQRGVSEPEPERAMSELQERFAKFLKKEAPLLLDMPLQPSDEEVGVLIKIRKEILLDIVKKINNDKYLTTRKNSVFQTIMELKQKEYGTT